jgi:hypothetical protein
MLVWKALDRVVVAFILLTSTPSPTIINTEIRKVVFVAVYHKLPVQLRVAVAD